MCTFLWEIYALVCYLHHQINRGSKRKRKEGLRTTGMGGIRNALSQIYISHAREEIKALHSFMFPLLMLLGHLFLPLPCSQFFLGGVGEGVTTYKLLLWNTMPQVYIETFCYLYWSFVGCYKLLQWIPVCGTMQTTSSWWMWDLVTYTGNGELKSTCRRPRWRYSGAISKGRTHSCQPIEVSSKFTKRKWGEKEAFKCIYLDSHVQIFFLIYLL